MTLKIICAIYFEPLEVTNFSSIT